MGIDRLSAGDEEYRKSLQAEFPLEPVLDEIYYEIGDGDNFTPEVQRNMLAVFDRLSGLYTPEMVIDHFVAGGRQDLHDKLKTADDYNRCYASFTTERSQMGHSEDVQHDERTNGSDSATFGMYRPAYDEAIESDKERLKSVEKPHCLLLGSYSEHSANEFYDFAKSVNPESLTAVVDLGRYGISRARPEILKIQGDVINLPIKTESQDIIASNLLTPFLRNDWSIPPSGENIMATLREAYRALKPGGNLVMVEKSVAQDRNNFQTSAMAALLLASCLGRVGFDDIMVAPAKGYPDHGAKLRDDRTQLHYGPHRRSFFEALLYGGLSGFEFVERAKKPVVEI